MSGVIIIGLDIAKHVFHAHGADERGRAVFRKRISRGRLLDFFAPSRVARWRWRHVVERITGPVSSPSLVTKFGSSRPPM